MAGLKAFRQGRKRTPVLRWADKQSMDLIFLHDLDQAEFVVEHTNPNNWTKSAECTFPQCYGCERAYWEPWSGWAQKARFYIDAEFSGEPVLITQTLTKHGIAQKLMDYHLQRGTICGILFTVTRVGNGKRVQYLLEEKNECQPSQPAINLKKQINRIPYEEQQNYYNT